MELMANSDNVLRGGLTPKHVDVPELLKHVVFEATHPNILKGALDREGKERVYQSPAPDFQLSAISLNNDQEFHSKSKTVEIFIVIDGMARVTESDTSFNVGKGEAFLVLAGSEFKISSEQGVFIFRATTPC
jgi:mannose-6-phosphate isomerase